MNDDVGDDEQPRARRHRHGGEGPEGLSVADLLARHGAPSDSPQTIPTNRHRLTDQIGSADLFDPPSSVNPVDPPDTFRAFEMERPVREPRAAELFQPSEEIDSGSGGFEWGESGRGRTEWVARSAVPLPLSAPTNLFAQLGRAEPDDSPTDVVPRVVDVCAAPPSRDAAVVPDAAEASEIHPTPDDDPPLRVEPSGRPAGGRHAAPDDAALAEPLDTGEDTGEGTDAPANAETSAGARHAAATTAISAIEPAVGGSAKSATAAAPGEPIGAPAGGPVSPPVAATTEESTDEPREVGFELRARKIDESLTRLTAIHAGLGREVTERVSRTGRLPVLDRTEEAPSEQPTDGGSEEPPAPPSGWLRAGRAVALVVALALFLGTAAGWGTQVWLNNKLRSVAALDLRSDSIVDPAGQTGDENFLLVGLDPSGSQPASRIPGVLPPALPAARTAGADTVMLAHVPASRDRVVVVAFPGGLAVDRPSCDRWNPAATDYPGGTTPAQSAVRLGSAYSIGGPRCVTKTIQKLTAVAVNHYISVDFAALKDMVDAVQGVPVCLTGSAAAVGNGGQQTSTDRSVLDGNQVLAFVRGQRGPGDPIPGADRIQRQQLFLAALLRKVTSDQVLGDFSRLNAFVTAMGNHALNDNAGLDSLTTLAQAMQNLDPTKISFVTVPTYGQPDTQGNELLQVDSASALFEAIRADRPLPSDAEADAEASAGIGARALDPGTLPPNAVAANVRNGSSRAGLANQAADSLRTLGFVVGAVGDAPPSPGGRTIIRHSPDRTNQAAVLAVAVPSAIPEVAPGTTGLLELVLGDSFDGQVRAAPASTEASSNGFRTMTGASTSCASGVTGG